MWCSVPRPSFLCQTCWPPYASGRASCAPAGRWASRRGDRPTGSRCRGLWDARLQQYGVARPASAPDSAGNLRLADLATCRQLLHEAGFGPIAVQREHVAYAFRTAEEWWTEMATSRSGLAVLQLAPAQRGQFQAEHLTEVATLATAQGI